MAEFPHMPLSTDAYLADTKHLRPIEHGVYLMLLMVAWRMPSTPRLPNDDRLLARYAGVNRSTWVSMRATIMAFWQLGDDGFWTQKKQVKVHQHVQKVSREAREKSAKRWAPKPLENNNVPDAVAYADDMPEGMQPKPYLLSTPVVPKGKALGKGKILTGYGNETDPLYADFLANIWSKRWQRPGHNPALAFAAFAKMTDADRTAAKGAIERCGRAIVAASSAPKYRPMLSTWLNSRGWEVDVGDPVPRPLDWPKLVSHFKACGEWLPGWGPRPGEPDCRVPREFLVEMAA